MTHRIVAVTACGAVLALGACSQAREQQTSAADDDASTTEAPSTTRTPTTTTTPAQTTTSTSSTTTTTTAPSKKTTTTTTSTTKPPKQTTTTTTTTTTTQPESLPGVHNAKCVVRIEPGDSLSGIARGSGRRGVTVESLQLENRISNPDRIDAGSYLDICVGNDVNDITGKKRQPPPPPPPVDPNAGTGVAAQQQKLNELFAPSGMPALARDGDSGSLTEQRLCAARLMLNLPVSRADMAPGSQEEQALMAAKAPSIPPGAPTHASRWVLIDRTCQVMFVGEGNSRVVYVFPTSTGKSGYGTRDQNGSRVFRYDPATGSGGWHNSTLYPVSGESGLNGNMYLPLYFDRGQAIHGANTVPTYPASHGCVRLPVSSEEALIDWLGLRDITSPTSDEDRINLSVTVQGYY